MRKGDLVRVVSYNEQRLGAFRHLSQSEISDWVKNQFAHFDSSGEIIPAPRIIPLDPDADKYYVVVKARANLGKAKTGFCELCDTDTGVNFFIRKNLVFSVEKT